MVSALQQWRSINIDEAPFFFFFLPLHTHPTKKNAPILVLELRSGLTKKIQNLKLIRLEVKCSADLPMLVRSKFTHCAEGKAKQFKILQVMRPRDTLSMKKSKKRFSAAENGPLSKRRSDPRRQRGKELKSRTSGCGQASRQPNSWWLYSKIRFVSISRSCERIDRLFGAKTHSFQRSPRGCFEVAWASLDCD